MRNDSNITIRTYFSGDKEKNQTSASSEQEVIVLRERERERPVCWLIEGLCPWHHSLRVKNCALRAKTHISHQHFFFFCLKKVTHPFFCFVFSSSNVHLNASSALDRPQWLRILVVFCLMMKWHRLKKASGVDVDISQPNLSFYSDENQHRSYSDVREKEW